MGVKGPEAGVLDPPVSPHSNLRDLFIRSVYCVVPGNIHSRGGGGFGRTQTKNNPWGRVGYFLEPQIFTVSQLKRNYLTFGNVL